MKCGLEIHQQLATGKLFCPCSDELTEEVRGEFVRRLTATGGETGRADAAAVLQAARGRRYRYQISPNSCLVEADEEPPHPLNPEALHVGLTMATLFGSRIVDEIRVMRKVVVDGSNTSGFQRTALIAVGGSVEAGGKRYGISSICLEEDAARKIGETPEEVTYRLDRLGIPLIEIATDPDIRNGREAREVAEAIGMHLRSTRKVKRGIGTIREDLNISIEGGSRVEIKGVQELGMVEAYVQNEADRQAFFLELGQQLSSVGWNIPDAAPIELTALLAQSSSKVLSGELKRGGVVLGLALPGLGGHFGKADKNPERLGRELADYARVTGVKGILHSDELPGYGISEDEVRRIREVLGVPTGVDGFALVVAPTSDAAHRALRAVAHRVGLLTRGVPEETRDPVVEGRTRYSRPLPGRHRMYPETDLAPFPVGTGALQEVRWHLPESPLTTLSRLKGTGLSPEIASTLLREGLVDSFDTLTGEGFPAPRVARLLTQEIPSLERELGRTVFEGSGPLLSTLRELLTALGRGEFAKEALGPVLARMVTHKEDFKTALKASGIVTVGTEDLRKLIAEVLKRNVAMVHTKGMEALSPLMGDVMKEVRGRIDGQVVAQTLREMLTEEVGQGATPAPRTG